MTYDSLPSTDTVAKTMAALKEHGYEPFFVQTREEALAKLKELVPAGVSVANGSSRTLEEIGYIDYLKEGKHGWDNLHAAVLAEPDPKKKAYLRKL